MYAFFLDIDGTIYDGNSVDQAVIDAITAARKAGHKVFINTARAYIGMPREIYDLPVDGWIGSLGLEVFADGKFIHRHFIPRKRVLEIAEYAFENKIRLYFEGEIRLDLNNQRPGSLNPQNIAQFRSMLGSSRICKFSLVDGATDRDKAAFSADFDFFDIEVIAKGHSKTRGIQIIQEYYGISQKDTVAIGDSDTDIDMISYAGIGISMGDGTPNLKACANYITRSLEDHGAAYAINRLIANKKADME